MASRPGRVRQVVPNALPHPREYQAPEFQRMVARLHDLIVSEQLPEEAPAPPAAGPRPLEPLPRVTIGEVIGLLEILRGNRGRMDVFTLDRITDYDFGHTLAVVKAAEMLEFVDTPKHLVAITDLGSRMLDLDATGRKHLLRERLLELETFRFLIRILSEAPAHQLPEDVVQEELVVRLPTQDLRDLWQAVIGWGRHAELFIYSPETATLTLAAPAETTENPPTGSS